MKQHITVEQLKDLKSDDKVCKLNTLMNHNWDLSGEEFKKYSWEKMLEDTAKYCTIGRMIEMLYRIDCDIYMESAGLQWYVNDNIIEYTAEELCDALWEAVKNILKEDVK